MSWDKNDISFKSIVNKRVTDSNKEYYEEFGDQTINVHFDDVWVSSIPSDPCIGILPDYIDDYTLLTLIVDPTVENNLTWAAVTDPSQAFSFIAPDSLTNPRLKDWISDKYGLNYEIQIFANGVKIQKTSQDYPWYFNYPTGELLFDSSCPLSPIQITGFRYKGAKGIVANVDASGTTSQTFQLYYTHDGVKLKDLSGNLEIRNADDDDYTGITAKYLNLGSDTSLGILNIKASTEEDLENTYFIIDNSTFNGTYKHPPTTDPSIINGKKAYSIISGDKCLYYTNEKWILQEIDSSLLSNTQNIDWTSNFFFHEENISGVYFGNTSYFGQNVTVYNYASTYQLAANIIGDIDIEGILGIHGKLIVEQLQLDPSFNGVLIANNGDVSISIYPKTKTYDTSIYGDGSSIFTINHNLGTFNHSITVYETSTENEIFPDKERGFNSDKLYFSTAPLSIDIYDVIILGF
jgi:hypothetical protein